MEGMKFCQGDSCRDDANGVAGQWHPITDFYIKDKKTGRRYAICRRCHTAKTTKTISENKERYAAYQRKYRKEDPSKSRMAVKKHKEKNKAIPDGADGKAFCSRCGQRVILSLFVDIDGREYDNCQNCRDKGKEYKASHSEEVAVANDKYRSANREAINLAAADYRQRNRKLLADRQRDWKLKHPERYAEIHSNWKKRNPELVNAATNRRRVRKAASPGHHTNREWAIMKAVCGDRCLRCGLHESQLKKRLARDHCKSLVNGGSDDIWNIEPLCVPCNLWKGTQNMDFRTPEQIKRLSELLDKLDAYGSRLQQPTADNKEPPCQVSSSP